MTNNIFCLLSALAIVCLLIIIYTIVRTGTQEYVIHGITINVVSQGPHQARIMRTMVECDARMLKLLEHLRAKYQIGATDAECNGSCRERIQTQSGAHIAIIEHILRGFNYEQIFENRVAGPRDVAYSLNKGSRIMLCLYDQERADVVNINTLMFVLLHEVAHIANYDEWGHGDRFWSIFKYLLQESASIGVYEPIDYSRNPTTYCRFKLTHNPYFDSRVAALSSNLNTAN